MENVTILVTLKDRPSYTYRLMRHLNELNCGVRVLLADGGSDESVENDLRNQANYPNVDYRYIRYPHDETLNDYYNKMKESAIAVDTPFVMCIDNDDLIVPAGVQKSVDFLKANSNYVASRGSLQGFSCLHIPSPIDYQGNMFTQFPNDITGNTAVERFIDQSQHFHTNSHNMMKREHLILETSVVQELNPTNLRFVEQLRGFLNVLWGNCNRETYNYLLHQHGTPRVKGGENQFPDQNTWITDADWPKNFAKMTDGIAAGIVVYDNIDIQETKGLIRTHYREMYYKRVSNKELLRSQIDKSKDYYRSDDQLMPLINQIKNIL